MAPSRLRLWAANGFIAIVLAVLAIDALPGSPTALRVLIQPALLRAGLAQGPWSMFSPDPDRTNRFLRAEIEYPSGDKVEWKTPIWRERGAGEVFLNHRRRSWWDRMISPDCASAWEPTCRYLARIHQPAGVQELAGTKVRLIYHEAPVPPAEDKPWPSVREIIPYDAGWILTSETLE